MKAFVFLVQVFIIKLGYCQLTIDNTSFNTTQLVNSLLGSGVTASNVSFRGVYNVSSRYQAGAFTASTTVATDLAMTSGVILSTGNTSDIPLSPLTTHPGSVTQISRNYVSGTTGEIRSSNSALGQDADVDILAGPTNYYNAAILEFDFVPSNSNISFNYVFGSEEYMDNSGSINYNCSSYNDKFGFLISGLGIAGGQGYVNNAKNIALLSNGSEVSINSVNNGIVGSSGGAPSAANCSSANPAWVQNVQTAQFTGTIGGINFNGNTKKLTATQSGLTPGATYHIRIMVSDLNDGAYDSGVFLQAGSFSSPITLPITLIDFTGKCNPNGINLAWQTASEQNNQKTMIERSFDGVFFESIGEVKGYGTTSEKHNYSFTDTKPQRGINYYRLKQLDFDGKTTIHKTIDVEQNCDNKADDSINIFPNPASDELNVLLKSLDIITTFEIIDQLGQVVSSYANLNIFKENGTIAVKLDLNELPGGFYYLKAYGDSTTLVSKFYKAN